MQEKDKCQILEKAEPAITGAIIYYIDTLIGIFRFLHFSSLSVTSVTVIDTYISEISMNLNRQLGQSHQTETCQEQELIPNSLSTVTPLKDTSSGLL